MSCLNFKKKYVHDLDLEKNDLSAPEILCNFTFSDTTDIPLHESVKRNSVTILSRLGLFWGLFDWPILIISLLICDVRIKSCSKIPATCELLTLIHNQSYLLIRNSQIT